MKTAVKRPESSESLPRLFQEYSALGEEILNRRKELNAVENSENEALHTIRAEVSRTMEDTHPDFLRTVFEIYRDHPTPKEKDRLKYDILPSLEKRLAYLGNELSKRLPTLESLKPGHIYRGTLLRRLFFSSTDKNEITIENAASGILPTGVNFAQFSHPIQSEEEAASWLHSVHHFALEGFNEDPIKSEERGDAVIVEVPFHQPLSDKCNQDSRGVFVPHDGLRGVSGIHLYQPQKYLLRNE